MMLSTSADRIRFARTLTKLSREAFEDKYGINRNTLKSWELGVNTLTEKSANLFTNAINSEGFSCSPQWLIFGLGNEPRPISKEDDELVLQEIDQQSKAIYEADYFKKNNHNSIVYMITDESMIPMYKPGDFVGGINENPKLNINPVSNSPCILTLNDEITIVRKIIPTKNKQTILCPLNSEYDADVVKNKEVISIAKIVWHRSTTF